MLEQRERCVNEESDHHDAGGKTEREQRRLGGQIAHQMLEHVRASRREPVEVP